MGKVAVQTLFKKIASLPQQDRLLLEERLARRAQADWAVEVKKARRVAKRKGINQTAIDQGVAEYRYGR